MMFWGVSGGKDAVPSGVVHFLHTLPSLPSLTSQQAAGDTEASLETRPESWRSHQIQIKSSTSL